MGREEGESHGKNLAGVAGLEGREVIVGVAIIIRKGVAE